MSASDLEGNKTMSALKDLSLRRSEVGNARNLENNHNVTINDDNAERRESRRRTILRSPNRQSELFEENETLKKCLEIYNSNKLSKDNAFSLPLIDTLTILVERHHKSLNNFKVAGSSLEASSKVYGLRVDSVHSDVLRMTVNLNARKISEQNRGSHDDTDDNADNNESWVDPKSNGNEDGKDTATENMMPAKKTRCQRKAVSTVTKNKDTLNARLDTVPVQDPLFAKLNSEMGSFNAPYRLMNNILRTVDSELILSTNSRFWDSSPLALCDNPSSGDRSDVLTAPCDLLSKKIEKYQLRPVLNDYIISDLPEVIAGEKDDAVSVDDGGTFLSSEEMSMAFDMNAECEPVPSLCERQPILDIDFEELGQLSKEDCIAINNCRGLRNLIVIEDMRPVDASSSLEYSYRPIQKISQFWAGPSHWKFKRSQQQSSVMSGPQGSHNQGSKRNTMETLTQRNRRHCVQQHSQYVNFGEFHDELFIKFDEKYKIRKINMQKNSDPRKLKLPTDMKIDASIFNYSCAPSLYVNIGGGVQGDTRTTLDINNDETDDEHHHHRDDLSLNESFFVNNNNSLGGNNFMNVSSGRSHDGNDTNIGSPNLEDCGAAANMYTDCNNTVLEIATSFEGAPDQMKKIIVPFAKRAKVINMKNLKKACLHIINKELQRPNDGEVFVHPLIEGEKYAPGVVTFQAVYKQLPQNLSPNMTESLSPGVALYSVLHLANDLNLRLIQEDDLNDFKIRQIIP